MSLLADVVEVLESRAVDYALIGAAAMALRGFSRSTADVDLLTLDPRVLDEDAWRASRGGGVETLLLRGDSDDPLAGTARLKAGAGVVDVVVGRHAWQAAVIEESERLLTGELSLPVARPPGLVLLKLFAGGPRDAWDVGALLDAAEDREGLRGEVDGRVTALPRDARELWRRLRDEERPAV